MVIVFPAKQALPCYWHTGNDDRSDNGLECRESFLPGSKARGHNSQQEAAYGPDSVGKYDPILHQWILEPDQEKWAARERAHANQVRLECSDLPFVKPAIAARPPFPPPPRISALSPSALLSIFHFPWVLALQ